MDDSKILVGDNRETLRSLPDASAQMVCTSPPYFGLRLYGKAGEEIGKERDLDAYVAALVGVMRECRRILRDDGCAWVNLGDSYASAGCGPQSASEVARPKNTEERAATGRIVKRIDGIPDGNALLVPFRVATALQADGWTLRAMLPWVKLAAMPESVQSRPCIAHEYVLFLTKRPSGYFYDADAVRIPLSPEVARIAGMANAGPKVSMKGNHAPGQNRHGNLSTGGANGAHSNPAGRSLRSSDFWRAGAREAGSALLAAADGEAVGMLTNDDAPAAFVVNPKGSGIPHFAMWPTRLVAPMVLAGTPEAGSCSACGAPWVRVVQRGETDWEKRKSAGEPVRHGHEQRTANTHISGPTRMAWKAAHPDTHLGFRPSCSHDAPTRPALILDPFVGAGTTIGVGEALGRRVTGCELYQANADLLPQRVEIVRAEVAKYLLERNQGGSMAAQRQGPTDELGPLFARSA